MPTVYPKAEPGYYHETIIMMMRYGGAVDRMAKELSIPEAALVKYIKESGLEQKMSRRSWRWKETTQKRRTMAEYRPRKKLMETT